MKKTLFTLSLVVVMILALSQAIFAFSDTAKDPNAKKIDSLRDKGILSGYGDNSFRPDEQLTYAEGITLIVKSFDLNIDHIRFIKQPLASDSFPNIDDDAWYSDSFIMAPHNGLEIPRDIEASDIMSKEQFAHNLFQAMMKQGDYAFIEIFMMIEDAEAINPDYMDNIQKLLISQIVSLDANDNFNPTTSITRGEAAGWLHDGLAYVDENNPIEPAPQFPSITPTLNVEAITDEVNKVTITATLPHPGYGLRIASIVFEGEQAIIHVEPTLPDPDRMYPMVISESSIVTYIDSAFEPTIANTTNPKHVRK